MIVKLTYEDYSATKELIIDTSKDICLTIYEYDNRKKKLFQANLPLSFLKFLSLEEDCHYLKDEGWFKSKIMQVSAEDEKQIVFHITPSDVEDLFDFYNEEIDGLDPETDGEEIIELFGEQKELIEKYGITDFISMAKLFNGYIDTYGNRCVIVYEDDGKTFDPSLIHERSYMNVNDDYLQPFFHCTFFEEDYEDELGKKVRRLLKFVEGQTSSENVESPKKGKPQKQKEAKKNCLLYLKDVEDIDYCFEIIYSHVHLGSDMPEPTVKSLLAKAKRNKPFVTISMKPSELEEKIKDMNEELRGAGRVYLEIEGQEASTAESPVEPAKEADNTPAPAPIEEPAPKKESDQAPVGDPFQEIKKYKELLDMGIISQEEFDKKKKELLGL